MRSPVRLTDGVGSQQARENGTVLVGVFLATLPVYAVYGLVAAAVWAPVALVVFWVAVTRLGVVWPFPREP